MDANTIEQPVGTVLIVDDDYDDARLTRRVIRQLSPQLGTRIVHSGKELISYLQGENAFSDRTEFPYPILLLLDLKMPGMDGFDVLLWLRNHPPHNFIPAVVLTGVGEVQLARQAYTLGSRSFLTKPLRPDEFKNMLKILREWLELTRSSPLI